MSDSDERPRANLERGRDETFAERMDRNWSELLQELRVTQTGAQVLTGFLLTVPFQQRFTALDSFEKNLYLALVVMSSLSTVLLVSPVSLHRFLFRRRRKAEAVTVAHRLARSGLLVLGLTIAGTVSFVFDVVLSRFAGAVAGGAVLLAVFALWVVLPLAVIREEPADRE